MKVKKARSPAQWLLRTLNQMLEHTGILQLSGTHALTEFMLPCILVERVASVSHRTEWTKTSVLLAKRALRQSDFCHKSGISPRSFWWSVSLEKAAMRCMLKKSLNGHCTMHCDSLERRGHWFPFCELCWFGNVCLRRTPFEGLQRTSRRCALMLPATNQKMHQHCEAKMWPCQCTHSRPLHQKLLLSLHWSCWNQSIVICVVVILISLCLLVQLANVFWDFSNTEDVDAQETKTSIFVARFMKHKFMDRNGCGWNLKHGVSHTCSKIAKGPAKISTLVVQHRDEGLTCTHIGSIFWRQGHWPTIRLKLVQGPSFPCLCLAFQERLAGGALASGKPFWEPGNGRYSFWCKNFISIIQKRRQNKTKQVEGVWLKKNTKENPLLDCVIFSS